MAPRVGLKQPAAGLASNNFDLLRIGAALQVLLLHGFKHLGVQPPFWWPMVDAFPGVPIFFVISGFLISKSYERSSTLANYARNRALRIYPALWLCIVLTIVVASLAGFSFFNRQAATWLPMQMAGLIYTPRFLESFGFGSYNGSLWTIPIELQFYMAVPIVYGLLRRSTLRFETGLAILLVVFTSIALVFTLSAPPIIEGLAEPMFFKIVRYTFAPHIYLFLAGVLLQRLQAERHAWVAGKGLHWMAIYLLVHFALPKNPWTEIGGTLVMAGCVVAVAFSRPGLSHRLLRGNDLSYGVYIYHGLLINLFLVIDWQAGGWSIPALVVAALVISLASWRWVERPILGRKRRTIHRVTDA